ncbi:MAG: hypothetical protein ACPGN3_09410 [Opitutales bacterium]
MNIQSTLTLIVITAGAVLNAQTLTWEFGHVPYPMERAEQVWEVLASGSAIDSRSGGSTVFTSENGLSGSLEGASRYFLLTMTAAQNFDPDKFTYELAKSASGSNPWLYNSSVDRLGVSSDMGENIDLDGGFPNPNNSKSTLSEAIVFEFDLSKLKMPLGYALQIDGLQVANSRSHLIISHFDKRRNRIKQLTGDKTKPNRIVEGENVFQPAPQIVRTGDKIALWSNGTSGNLRQLLGIRFSLVRDR